MATEVEIPSSTPQSQKCRLRMVCVGFIILQLVFLLGKFHGQRSLVRYVHEITKSWTWLSDWERVCMRTHTHTKFCLCFFFPALPQILFFESSFFPTLAVTNMFSIFYQNWSHFSPTTVTILSVSTGWASLSQRSKQGFLSQWTRKLLVFGGSKPENTQDSWLDTCGLRVRQGEG